MMDINGGDQNDRHTLARELLHILGDFPVHSGRSDNGTTESRGLQEPLWFIGGLAKRGWDLHSLDGNGKRIRHPTALPSATLPSEDARLLSKWTPQALQKILLEQSRYYEHGLLSSKCDVADALDPIHHGLITDERARELFQAYWEMIHPQWTILDPCLHSLTFVRGRSALLTSTILALGSTALATRPESREEEISEALRLHAYVEKLNLVVYATGARSIDIIQAHILLSRWGTSPKARVDEQRWMRAAMIPRMASEIGLNLPRHYDESKDLNSEKVEKLQWNDIRTRGFIILNEYRFFTYSGRQSMDLSQFELTETEVEELTRQCQERSMSSLAAFYHLFLFERDVRRRIEQYRQGPDISISLDAELEHIKTFTEKWISDWCQRDGDNCLNWHLTHDALSCWLLLAVRIARKRPQSYNTSHQQQLLLALSTRIFKEALRASQAIHTSHRSAIFPFAASIILRLSTRRDLVLRLALRMTGEPGKPHVSTFVRDAGNQLLVMLCTNNLKPPAPTGEAEEESNRSSTSSGQASEEFNDSHIRDETQQSTENPMQDQIPTRLDRNWDDLSCLPVSGLPFGPQAEANNIFALNSAYFPYVPDPTQPRVQFQDSMLPPYPSADLDALIGTAAPLDLTGTDSSALNAQFQSLTDNSQAWTTSLENNFGFPLQSMTSTQGHSQPGRENANWALGESSPVDTAFTNGSSTNEEDHSAQREVLLATAGRLIQLASQMQ